MRSRVEVAESGGLSIPRANLSRSPKDLIFLTVVPSVGEDGIALGGAK